jgi:hypothetical protein
MQSDFLTKGRWLLCLCGVEEHCQRVAERGNFQLPGSFIIRQLPETVTPMRRR